MSNPASEEPATVPTAIEKKLAKPGPRKLLALDSGGVRGIITIEILAEIEQTLRTRFNQGPDFVLADYFDYIGGTSIGAVLATCLSLGMSVAQIRRFYLGHAHKLFQKAPWWNRWRYKYRCEPLRQLFQSVFEDAPASGPEEDAEFRDTLGSTRLRTLLLLVVRNVITDSPWPISNNPRAKYNCNPACPACNLRFPLWQLIRASTAAPSYFPPEVVQLGGQTFAFDDGGVTPFANPAFQLFLMATLPEYRLHWPAGAEQLLLVSVGTGRAPHVHPAVKPQGDHLLYYAKAVPGILIGGNVGYQDLLCRVFGRCRVGDPIDGELQDLIESPGGPVDPKLFTYLRYDADLSAAGLEQLGFRGTRAAAIRKLDSTSHLHDLGTVGQAAARKVQAGHFAGFSP
jgi:uncharacterized protein